MKKAEAPASKWCTPEGSLIACTEKNKVMAENLEEIKGYLQDAIDDAVLMGCSEASFREAAIFDGLCSPRHDQAQRHVRPHC